MIQALLVIAVAKVAILIVSKLKRRAQRSRVIKRSRKVIERKDPYGRSFWADYLDPSVLERVSDPTTYEGKQFRRRFRVPFPVFLDLLEKTRDMGFADHRTDICGRPCVPLGSKLLGVLRVLGRGVCFDDIALSLEYRLEGSTRCR